MHRGLAIIPGGLLAILLFVGAAFASDAPCPITPNSHPRLFLQTDFVKLITPFELGAHPESHKDYQLDASLIGAKPSSTAPSADDSPVEIGTEKDLAALRLKTGSAIIPYVGAGVTSAPEPEETPGISTYEAEREAERMAYMLGAGFACDLSHSARFNLGYRFAGGTLPELPGIKPSTTEAEREDHHISFGLKFDF